MIYFSYIKNLVFDNPRKIILILSCFVIYYFIMNLGPLQYSYDIVSTIQGDNKCYFIIDKGDDLDIKSDSKSYSVIGSKLEYTEIHPLTFLLIALLGFSLVVIIVLTFSGDSDEGFNFYQNWIDTNIKYVELEIEDGNYYYVLRGRLLTKQDRRVSNGDIRWILQDNLGNLNLLPRFEGTKSKIRDSKINKILS